MKYKSIEDPNYDFIDEITQADQISYLSIEEQFGKQLVGELPRCPECSKLLKKRTLKRCDYCGFSFSYLEKLLPVNQLPPLETVLDFSKKLESDEKDRILRAITYIKKRYPQFIPKVCLLPLQPEVAVQQMGLWMINQCPLAEGETEANKEWYLFLLIDTTAAKCCLSYGYQAEVFIPDESSSKEVSILNKSLDKDRIGRHIEDFLYSLVSLLDSTKKMLVREYKHFKSRN